MPAESEGPEHRLDEYGESSPPASNTCARIDTSALRLSAAGK
jgi:hypothetical protein